MGQLFVVTHLEVGAVVEQDLLHLEREALACTHHASHVSDNYYPRQC